MTFLNIQNQLLKRILTALLILPPVLGIIYLGGFLLILLSLLVFSFISFEYYSFSTPFSVPRRLQLTAINLLIPLGYLFYGARGFAAGVYLAMLLLACLHIIYLEAEQHEYEFSRIVPATYLGVAYPGIMGSMLVIVSSAAESFYILWLLGSVIIIDTASYFGGSLIGGLKLAPRISPKKTVSGALCGVICAVLGSIFLGQWLKVSDSVTKLAMLGVLIAVLSIFGDLAESLVKRIYSVKDSGSILPGHGGLFDRVDALIFALPVVLLLI